MACILTLPPYQRRGYGKLLIEFSEYLCCWLGAGGRSWEAQAPSLSHAQMLHTDMSGCCVLSPGCAVQSPGELARNKDETLPRFSPYWGDCPLRLD